MCAKAFLNAVEAPERERHDQIWVAKRSTWLQCGRVLEASGLEARRLVRRLWPWAGDKLMEV